MQKTNSFLHTKYAAFSISLFFLSACTNGTKEEGTGIKDGAQQADFKPIVLKDTIGGVYHEYYKNGKIKIKGVLKEGKRDGDWSYFYQNGNLWSWGEYADGKRNGASSVYYENGVLRMEGNYSNDKQSGLWKFYNEKGEKIKEVAF